MRHRVGYTLLELLLALALSVLATALIGALMQLYANNFNTRGEDIRRVTLARNLLNMIADDLRSTVTKQELDTSVLQQMLVGQSTGGAAGGQAGQGGGGQNGGGQGGGGQNGGGQGGGGQNGGGQGGGNTGGQNGGGNSSGNNPSAGTGGQSSSQQSTQSGSTGGGRTSGASGGTTGGMTGGSSGMASSSQGTGGASGSTQGATGDPNATGSMLTSSMPLGMYGSQYELTLDISRLPRPDEYMAQQNSLVTGTLPDVPGDIKSISYYVQPPTATGVADSVSQIASTSTDQGMPGGLVRRQIDRNVLAYAEEQGQVMQLQQTGELVAPEVISLDFMYFDGMQWTTSWDSSTQSLPWLVEISLAMQSATGEKQGIVPPGTSIVSMPAEEQARLGIQVYRLVVAIPGAQLQAATPESMDQAAGMQSLGLP